jgi:hypothetical protein
MMGYEPRGRGRGGGRGDYSRNHDRNNDRNHGGNFDRDRDGGNDGGEDQDGQTFRSRTKRPVTDHGSMMVRWIKRRRCAAKGLDMEAERPSASYIYDVCCYH